MPDQVPVVSGNRDLDLMRKRFDGAAQSTANQREKSLKCLQFTLGDQWDPVIETQREQDKRPALTVNRIPEFLAQVENEQRQQRPSIKVTSATEGDEARETAEILEDLIRGIQSRSNAEIAYDTAFKQMLIGGFGAWRVGTKYAGEAGDPDAFNLDITIEPIWNPFTVYIDPAARAFDKSDMRWAIIATDIPRSEFTEAYPKAKGSLSGSGAEFSSIGDDVGDWCNEDKIRVVEYFTIKTKRVKLLLTDGGQVIREEDLAMIPPEDRPAIMRERFCDEKSVIWRKCTGFEVLEESVFPGQRIPIIPVYGDVFDVNGHTHYVGMVENGIEPQRMLNYWLSAATEQVALAPRAPYLVALGQTEGLEAMWNQANTRNFPYLFYKPVTVNGSLAPPPQRNQFEPAIAGISQMFMMFDQQIKSTMRIYNAGLGDTGPEQSGRAILARQKQANIANLNYSDNLARAIGSTGRLIMDLIPLVYDTERIVSILSMDGRDRQVWLNKPFRMGAAEKIYDVRTGKYYVSVHTGPTYETKRQEAAASMVDMAKVYPPLMQVAGDLVVSQMDWPGAQDIADRLRKALPPGMAEEEESDIPPQAQAIIGQMQAQIQQLSQVVNEQAQEIEGKRLEMDSKERIASMDAQVKLVIEEMKLQGQQNQQLLQAELAGIKHRLELMAKYDEADRQAEQIENEKMEEESKDE